ncbi:Eco57I restriction-modification methylase domain-containing protein [Modestobacter sp. VKM Ac-2979]|uniref:Eco57I restriction-modification methylase domain-containing protein n=1 Tax=unclassified Modestobacter TaxID=2643866 RepID=UPI0022ABBE71|nr:MULTISPECIES: Eco57I restriction-modification methylase domain-containing protein [unclassified Modestobacter]MCZ2813828.1 Eco57I restriction-modification methylase domain-containing protein [Modestobacter sp. VKM Ac-2979]MCZ2844197.1 Eco57I restriction-modification methylase domain-containing protein [Modestobacter sp. VKM Ac-2980]
MLQQSTNQPDILEVISDLSNDEVFTPPKVANAVLDLLPDEVWSNPDLRWLDPGTKTGVFLREVTRRLLQGLSTVIPDEEERLRHILTKQVVGVAITELTALMARRTVYCSKDASGPRSTIAMPTSAGNIWMNRVEHSYVNGRCPECGASEALMERDNRENHAYGFIHQSSLAELDKEFGMKFDVIVGNPPYQMTGGGGGSGHSPLYNVFMDQAKALNPRYISMIIPSRWMAGGRGLDNFRVEMLGDRRIRRIVDYPNAAELFPTVDIKSGVCYFLWDRDNPGTCQTTLVRDGKATGPDERRLNEFDVLIRDTRAVVILRKVLAKEEQSLQGLVAGAVPFGLTSNFNGYKKGATAGSKEVTIHASTPSGQRNSGSMSRNLITKNVHLIDAWKVLAPKAGPGSSGGHILPDMVLGRAMIAGPRSVCTETFLPIGPLASKTEAESLDAYLRTRFLRFLVSLRKISQDAMRGVYRWVPQQPWDRTWTDEELYAKYDITPDEQAFIAAMVREMPA